MTRRRPWILLCLGLAPLLAAPVSAQPAEEIDVAPNLLENVAGIRQSLGKLVELLEELQRRQELDLILKRIEMRERRVAPLERRLSSARSEAESLETEIKQMQLIREQHEETLRREIHEGNETEADGTRRMIEELTTMLEVLPMRLEEAQTRVRRLEDEMADGLKRRRPAGRSATSHRRCHREG